MKARYVVIGSAVVASMFGGASLEFYPGDSQVIGNASHLEALLDPIDIATQMCGDATRDGYARTRAPFLRMGHLQAAEVSDAALRGDEPPLWQGLGETDFPVTTVNGEAQRYFNQGIRLANDFNHLEAVRSFRWAQQLDPQCAMCYWGEALALGPNINAPMQAEAAAQAYAATQKAVARSEGASAKEQALIGALQARYASGDLALRAQNDNAYAKSMLKVAQTYSDDDHVLALAAEAMMTAQPWDYWEADNRTPKGRTGEVLALLEAVLARNPDHPAAIHLYIHLTEASNDPYRAEAGADRLVTLAPAAGHLVHMPSHIYHRVGRYIDSYRINLEAVRANEAYLADVEASPIYEYGYYTHNIHMGLVAAQMAGDAEEALRLADKLDAKMPASMVELAPWIQAIKVAPYFAYVQFAPAEKVLALEKPGDEFPYLQTMWHYARGEVMARQGDRDKALKEAAEAESFAEHATMRNLEDNGMPASALARIAAEVVRARSEINTGQLKAAIDRLERAAALQDELFYSEPVFWYFPVRQMLGAALLMDGQAHRAEAVFIRALVDVPNNGWALYGLREAQVQMGNEAAANYADTLFRQAWLGDAEALLIQAL